MPLIDTVGTWVLANLPYDRSNDKVVAALKSKNPTELLVVYLNWCSRLVPALPRQVLKSDAFEANPLASTRQPPIHQIIRDIEDGKPLNKYLSRRVRFGFDLPADPSRKQLDRRRDLDLLLNDWGIHHLHISTEVEADGFVRRNGPLIFAMFKTDRAYLIDIMDHQSWTSERAIRTILSSWPNEGLVHEMKGIHAGETAWTDKDRAQLRAAGISTSLSIDRRVYMPGSGISTDGTSPHTLWKATQILRTLKLFEEQANASSVKIAEAIRQRGGEVSDTLSFAFSAFENGYGVIETNSGLEILLSQ
jgi:hypothetical protein